MAAGWRRRSMVGVAMLAALTLAGCRSDEPELTVEERLEALEGRSLSAGEVADLLSVADALCGLDDRVLDRMWLQLDDDQLDFQDFVFGQRCPERAVLYAGHTGRYVTDEAQESGVTPSTTRPPTTTVTTTRPTTASTATSGTDPTGSRRQGDGIGSSVVPGADDGESDTDTSTTATTATTTGSTRSSVTSSGSSSTEATNPGEGG